MSQATGGGDGIVRSLVPARMDRLPWSGFHWRVVIALGITWVLEGVEIALAGAIGGFLNDPANRGQTLYLDASMVGWAGFVYLTGEIVDIAIAGTYWGGAMMAAGAGLFLLNTDLTPADWGWRIALLLGPVIGISIWPLRKR
jgi:hypothetical protein